MRRLPAVALLLGVAGLVPFLVCGYGALATRDVVDANYWLLALCGYGAVILAFLGGVHWGFVLGAVRPEDSLAPPVRRRYRLVMGVLPALGGWAAVLVMFAGQAAISLVILIVGFLGFTSAESELHRRGLVPPGYLVMRWGLTLVVAVVLGGVLAMRMLGASINL